MKYKKIIGAIVIISLILTSTAGYAYLSWLDAKFPGNKDIPLKHAVSGKPVNYLLMGSDSRGEKYARADTIVIFRIDPKHNLAYIVSIPRDLRVDIPGHGKNKINAATAFGGPKLMIKTVEEFTGLEVNHYALLNFKGFKRIIDSLGGIEVNVEKEINSNEPGYEMHIKKGRQVLNGTKALNYVRFRHDAEGDLGRIKRQQQFFKALSTELLSIRTIPKIPNLVKTFADNTQSDMSSREMLSLAFALKGLNKKKQQMVTLPGTGAYINGISYLIPEEKKINSILSDIKQGKKIDQEKFSIKIKVKNGSGVQGKALEMKNELTNKGFNVIAIGTAYQKNNGPVIIYSRPRDKEKAKKVASAIPGSIIKLSASVFKNSYIDIMVVTGKY